jgi:choline dehydrogenase-like flavoprotein
MAAESCIECDVAIVGAGFAGALIANELGKHKKKVVILEAGEGLAPNINDNMNRFYLAAAKVPESPYTPTIFDADGQLRDPSKVAAGRPTVMSLGSKGGIGDWTDPKQSYLIQKGQFPFGSTYDRVAGGTAHWLGTCLRFVPNDFKMKSLYGNSVPQFVDWPIDYNELDEWYEKAEIELGVSGNKTDQIYLEIKFRDTYDYPMPQIPKSYIDLAVEDALKTLTADETKFLGMATPPTEIQVRGLPAARNSQPYRNRRACAGNTNCIPICPIQAKYDPTIALNDAVNNNGVRLMHRTVASNIVVDENGRTRQIDFIQYRRDSGPRTDRGCVMAKVFVLAANAIETPRLLLMSRNWRGVANSSDMVGRHLMDHPYYVAWGLTPQPRYPYRGPLITSGIGDLCDGPFRSERGAFRVDIGNEGWNFVVGGDPNVTTVDFVNGMNRTGLNPGPTREALFGMALAKKLNDKFTRQFRCGFLVEQTPDRSNRVKLSDIPDGLGLPRPEIHYNLSDYTKRGIIAAHKMKNLMFAKMGITTENDFTTIAPNDPTRFDTDVDGKRVSLNYIGAGHIMGTCRMGDDPRQSVVDRFQRSHDHRNLYIAGSSTFPTGATANPTLTLAALSLRTAKHILDHGFD